MQRGKIVYRLVEKPGASTTATSTTNTNTTHRPTLPQEGVAWSDRGGGGGGGGGGTQQTQYIRRLVTLRDDLITQEETALAKAVDRLRLHSLHNSREVARYRLKLKDPGGESPRVGVLGPQGPQGPCVPRPMMTTVEKFRQMRPQRRQPILFPLQGKQLIESSSVSNGSTPGSCAEDGPKTDPTTTTTTTSSSSCSPPYDVDDTVNLNLQRLIYPSSSIPNIGRKALRRQEALELRTQPLTHARRHKAHRASRPLMASPFRLQFHGHHHHHHEDDDDGGGREGGDGWRGDASSPSPTTSPPRMETTMVDGDRLDMDKLNQYYYVYCLPEQPLEEDEEERRKAASRFLPAQGGKVPPSDRLKPRRTHSERPPPLERARDRRPYSDRTAAGGNVSSSSSSSSSGPSYRRTMGMLTGPDRIALPVIYSGARGGPNAGGHGKGREAFGGCRAEEDEVNFSPEAAPSTERRKRHIVIDMPHIIFSSATPDVTREPTLVDADPHAADSRAKVNKALNDVVHRELESVPLPDP